MRTFADIANGQADWADIFFLVAAIVAGVDAVVRLIGRGSINGLLAVAVCLVALGLLVL